MKYQQAPVPRCSPCAGCCRDRGATIVEFAIVIIPLTIIIGVFIEIALHMKTSQALANAALFSVSRAATDPIIRELQVADQNFLDRVRTIEGAATPLAQQFGVRVSGAITATLRYPATAAEADRVPLQMELTAPYRGVFTALLPSQISVRKSASSFVEPNRPAWEPPLLDCMGRNYFAYNPPGSYPYGLGCYCNGDPNSFTTTGYTWNGSSWTYKVDCMCSGDWRPGSPYFANRTSGTNPTCQCPAGRQLTNPTGAPGLSES